MEPNYHLAQIIVTAAPMPPHRQQFAEQQGDE